MRFVLALLLAMAAVASAGGSMANAANGPPLCGGGQACVYACLRRPKPTDRRPKPHNPPPPTADIVSTDTYKCDPTVCKPPGCMCASNSPPGNLTKAQIPQFILVRRLGGGAPVSACYEDELERMGRGGGGGGGRLPCCRSVSCPLAQLTRLAVSAPQLNHANALGQEPFDFMMKIINNATQSNGCEVPVTWFAMFYHSGARA